MKKAFSRLVDTPLYPLFFGAYPVVYLLAVNAGQVNITLGIRPLLLSLLLSVALVFLGWLWFREIHRASFFSMLAVALFFAYGHIYNAVELKSTNANFNLWLPLGWGGLCILAFYWVTRPSLMFAQAAPGLNLISLALVVMSAYQLDFSLPQERAEHGLLGADHAPIQEDLTLPNNPPDVYFFLLDSYARADNLKISYNYDNSDFINGLQERGFYVAECSQSNYTRTELSLASTLNMQYLHDLDDEFERSSTSRTTLWDSLQHSAVRYNFETLGYQTINFATGFDWLELRDADRFYSPPPLTSSMTSFEGLLLRTTLARYVEMWGWTDPDAIMGREYRSRFNLVFNTINALSRMRGPQFNYIHLIAPHPPFIYNATGRPINPGQFLNDKGLYPADLYAKGYVGQLQFLNKKMLAAVDVILKNSKQPPIIIIQGDHGPWLQPKDRHMWILNAIYLPGHSDSLYPRISPVNTFRLVFNLYFGGKYEMLEDVSYYSPVPNLYDFSEVKNHCGE